MIISTFDQRKKKQGVVILQTMLSKEPTKTKQNKTKEASNELFGKSQLVGGEAQQHAHVVNMRGEERRRIGAPQARYVLGGEQHYGFADMHVATAQTDEHQRQILVERRCHRRRHARV